LLHSLGWPQTHNPFALAPYPQVHRYALSCPAHHNTLRATLLLGCKWLGGSREFSAMVGAQ
jgi:hypothetical protein